MTTPVQQTAPRVPAERAPTVVVGTLALATFVGMLGSFGLTPFLPVIAGELGVGVALLGQVPSLTNLLAAALGLVIGPLADGVGARRLLLLGLLAGVVGAIGVAVSVSYGMLLLVAVFTAVGRAAVLPVAQAIAGGHYTGAGRRRAIQWTIMGLSATAIVGIPLLTLVDAVLGWRAAFGGLALLSAGVVVLGRRTLPPDGPIARERVRLGAILPAYAPLRGHRATLGLLGWTLVGQVGISAVFVYLGAFLVQQHGLPGPLVGASYLVVGLGYFCGSTVVGGRVGHLAPRPLVIGSRVLEALLLAGGLGLPVGAAAAMTLITLGTIMGGVNTVTATTLLVSDTPAGRATTMTANGAAMSLGAALGGGLGGLLLTLGGYSLLGLGVLTCMLASSLVVWLARPPLAAAGPARVADEAHAGRP